MSRSFRHGKQQKQKTYGDDHWGWYRREPKLWRHFHKHVPRRREESICQFHVLSGNPDILWPLDKKPWIYYW